MALCSSVRGIQACKPSTARVSHATLVNVPIRISCRNVSAKAADMTPEMREQMAKAMQDPAMQQRMKQMQEMMSRPEMQQQMAEMQAYMQNQQLQQRMQELRNDPEFKSMFEEIQSGGMGALMKYMNDPRVLAKIGEKIGDVPPPTAAAAAPASAAAAAANVPEIDNLFDAARYGDLEAVEDFIAIGKDVNAADKESRTPLHYASGFDHPEIAQMLIDEGAKLEAQDSKGNTPLHYAAGYGRAQLVELLLTAGSNASAKNIDGQTPYELVLANERNPLNANLPVMDKLRDGVTV